MKNFCALSLLLFAFLVFADNAKVLERVSDEVATVEKVRVESSRTDPEVFAVPLRLNYQGFLTDDSGNAIDDTATMVFRIFTASVGGSELWSSGAQLLEVENGVFHYILASVPLSIFDTDQQRWLELAVRGQVLSPRTEITSVAWSYVATLADSADGAGRLGGQDLNALDTRYINNGESAGNDLSGTYPNPTVIRIQTRPVSSAAPTVGQILKWDGTQWALANDTIGGADADWIISGYDMYSNVSGNVGIGTASPHAKLHVNGVIRGGVGNTVNATYGAVLGGYVNLAGDAAVDTGAVICGGGNNGAISRYSTVGGGRNNTASDYATTVAGGSGNMASNSYATVAGGRDNTATGIYSTIAGGNSNYAIVYGTIGGGYRNYASGIGATIGGGESDSARGNYSGVLSGYNNRAGDASTDTGAVVCGGLDNAAIEEYASVGGGGSNSASGTYTTVAGGLGNVASSFCASVGGGRYNSASGSYASVSGGGSNIASTLCATIGGGDYNRASGVYSTVGGGTYNMASGAYATIAGGVGDTCGSTYGFATGYHSIVYAGHNNSAAFNGQNTTTSAQTRVGILSKASGTFTIDHPLDPMKKILNHYFVESPEMVLIYRGIAVIGAGGLAEVHLPDYYDELNKNSQVQLTGVGTYEVYVAEEVQNNRFVIGGKPGTKVHWVVTGERKDPSAEITKIIMPVEQAKDGELAGRSLDDDFLCATREQLERMGRALDFQFRQASGQQRYEEMKRMITENR